MANINRDYIVRVDVKTGKVTTPKIKFKNVDKSTSNIYVQLVIKETPYKLPVLVEEVEELAVLATIIKPNKAYKTVQAVLVDTTEGRLFELNLPDDCINLSGTCKVELTITGLVDGEVEQTTADVFTYIVEKSLQNELDPSIQDSEDLPVLKQLIQDMEAAGGYKPKVDVNGSIIDSVQGVVKIPDYNTRAETQAVIDEVGAARIEADGTAYTKLGDRLNKVDSQIKENMNKINDDKVYVNDFEDIQSAINYAYENNIKNVLLEGKTYEIDKTIILYEGIRLFGTSKLNTKIIKINNSYSDIKGYNNAEIDSIIHIVKKDSLPTDNVKDVVIENISLCGNTNNRNKYGIYVHNMALSNLSNLYIEGVEEGLFSFAYIWDSKLSQIRIHNAYRGFHIGSSTSLILENCYASSCKNYGFYLNNLKYSNVLSCACDLVGNASLFENTENDVSYAYYIKNGDGVLISSCGSEQTNGTCLKIVNSKNVSVNNMTNLFIKSNNKGLTDDYVSSYELDNNNGVIFTNSYFSYLDNGYTGNNNFLNHLKSIVRTNNNNVVINNIQIDNCNYSEFDDKLTNLIDTRSCYTGHDTVYTDKNIYVSTTTGNDIVNDGSYEKPFKTINKALNSLPRFIEATVQIRILDGDYYEYPIVKNFRGSGSLKVMSHSKDKTKVRIIGQAQKPVISINSNSCNIIIDSISVFAKTSNATCVRSYLNTSMIEIRNCKLDSWGSEYTNVIAVDSNRSICDLLDTCESTHTTTSIKSDYASNVIKYANALAGDEISQHGGIIR